MSETETVTVARADLHAVVSACLRYLPDDVDPDIQMAFGRLNDARHDEAAPAPEPEDPRPEGIYARVELPGYRHHTGWITEEPRFGLQMAVVRDWDGREVAMVAVGPGCQVVAVPAPLKRPEPPRAIGPGWGDTGPDENDEEDDLDDDADAAEMAF